MQTPAKLGVFFFVLAAIVLFGIQMRDQTSKARATTSQNILSQDNSTTVPPITKVANTDTAQKKLVASPVSPRQSNSAVHRTLAKHHPGKSSTKPIKVAKRKRSRKLAPKRTLTDLDAKHANALGKQMQLGTPGKWTVVHFWATWCNSCVRRSPDLVKLHSKYAPHGVEFFGVNLDKDSHVAAKYMTKVGLAWPQMMTKQGWQSPIRLEYDVPTIPAVYLVSPNGRVVEAGMGGFADADTRLKFHLSGRSSQQVTKR